jgi:hypothetical protein
MLIISFQQQELLLILQRAQTALHPKLDLRPSIFLNDVDNFIDGFREEPVKYLIDRPKDRFFGQRDPSFSKSNPTKFLFALGAKFEVLQTLFAKVSYFLIFCNHVNHLDVAPAASKVTIQTWVFLQMKKFIAIAGLEKIANSSCCVAFSSRQMGQL